MQLTINEIVATAVNSSIREDCLKCNTVNDVKTRKQSPNRLDEVLSMCVDLFMMQVYYAATAILTFRGNKMTYY